MKVGDMVMFNASEWFFAPRSSLWRLFVRKGTVGIIIERETKTENRWTTVLTANDLSIVSVSDAMHVLRRVR